jgi:hypothetical protein
MRCMKLKKSRASTITVATLIQVPNNKAKKSNFVFLTLSSVIMAVGIYYLTNFSMMHAKYPKQVPVIVWKNI